MAKKGGLHNHNRTISRINDLDKARRMFEMRLKGVSLMVIATTFKCTPAAVHGILDKYTRQELLPYVEDYREMTRQRYEYLWKKLVDSGRLEKGDPAAFNAAANLLRGRRELDGLDAPTKIELGVHIDPKEIELRQLILEAQNDAKSQIKAIKGSVEAVCAAEVVDDEEDDDGEASND